MKTFIGIIGVFSLIVSLGTFLNGMYAYLESTTVMQQGVAMQLITYSGLMLIASIIAFIFGDSEK